MTFPAAWTVIPVIGTYINRDGNPCEGWVSFSSPQIVLGNGTVLTPQTITFQLDSTGSFSGSLPATDDPLFSPANWAYTVLEKVPDGRQPFDIQVPHTSAGIDMSTVVPVAPPPTLYPYVSAVVLAGATGSSLVGFEQAGTGATLRTAQDELRETVRPEQFGAKFDGATDDTTAIQDAITYLKSLTNGGYLVCPAGASVISATINIDQSNIGVIGKGAGKVFDNSPINVAGTQFSWAGAVGGTMFNIAPPSGAVAPLTNCDFAGIQLIGQVGAGNKAALGLNVSSCSDSKHDVSGNHFSTAILNYTISSGLTEASDCQRNDIWVFGYQEASTDGALFICDSPTVSSGTQGNFSFNRVWQVAGNHFDGIGIIIKGADNNDFFQLGAYRASGGTATYGIEIIDSASRGSNSNNFYHVSATAGVVTSNVNGHTSNQNNILFYDKQNGSPDPVVGTGCDLWWGSNLAPVGYRSVSLSNSDNYKQVTSDGRYRYSGKAAGIAPGGSTTITFATALPNAVIRASATPVTFSATSQSLGINVTTTGITIYNPNAGSIDAWWEVEGY